MSENKHTPEPFGAELKRLAEKVTGWSSCNAAWSIVYEDDPEYLTAAVGAIGEDGEEYPVAIVDCDNYFAGSDSLHLARFYAAANPKAVLEIIKQRDELLAALERIASDDEVFEANESPEFWPANIAIAAIARVKGEQ